MELPEQPAHRRFIEWWRAYAAQMHIPYSWSVSEPSGPRIVRRLLERFGLEELKRLAVHFFLDHGQMLRENPHHFAIFASMVNQMKEELRERES